jgi:hypothetical protein
MSGQEGVVSWATAARIKPNVATITKAIRRSNVIIPFPLNQPTEPGAPLARCWAETTADIRLRFGRGIGVNASLAASIFHNQPVRWQGQLGITQHF